MILTCPSCSTRYAVDPAALGADGRKVKCARCSHQWLQTPPPPAAEPVDASPVDPPPVSPPPAMTPRPIPAGSNLPAPRRPVRRRSGGGIGWLLLALVVAGLIAIGYVGRQEIVRLWPPAIKLYEELGVDVATLDLGGIDGITPGLAFVDVTSEWTDGAGGPVLWVRGAIANDSTATRTIPPLRAALVGPEGRPLADWTFTVDPPDLAPGESARFETSTRNVDDSAEKLLISSTIEP